VVDSARGHPLEAMDLAEVAYSTAVKLHGSVGGKGRALH